MNVYVFKNSIHSNDLTVVASVLNTVVAPERWNVDVEDCDNILRVESPFGVGRLVCQALAGVGIRCTEL